MSAAVDTQSGRPAVFLDRDGTLTEEVGYVNHPRRLRLLPRAAEAVRRLNDAGIAAVVVTNQAGMARGYFSSSVLAAVTAELVGQLGEAGARLDGIYFCPHHPTEGDDPYRVACECRKPKPGLVMQAAQELRLDVARSVVVGDRPTDLELAARVGAKGVLVLTGYGLGEWEYRRDRFPAPPHRVAADVLDAVDWALSTMSTYALAGSTEAPAPSRRIVAC